MNTPTRYEHEDRVEWRLPNGDFHREDGPALIFTNGNEYWYLDNKRHREDGPAAIYFDGEEHWYKNGKRHRVDGPAVIYSDGNTEYWIEGIEYDPVTFLIKSYEYTDKE